MRTRTLHEYRCTFCDARAWSARRPSSDFALLRRVPRCSCGRPMLHRTGATRQQQLLRDVRKLL